MKRNWLLVVLYLMLGCSGTEGISLEGDVTTDTGPVTDLVRNVDTTVVPDIAVDATKDQTNLPDFSVEDTEPEQFSQCDAGDGCFGDPCVDNGECLSGWCVEHLGEGTCTTICQEECPPGWACKAVGAGPDVVSICVSSYANLCKPCASNSDCVSPAGEDDACMSYAHEGSFCGGLCETHDDCPWGFACVEGTTVDGVALTQCLSETGACPCAGKSVALGLWTPCQSASDAGVCEGKRVCTDEGLSPCDAAQPEMEQCNGVDDDCDGLLDEPLEVDGNFVNLCDDGNACSEDICGGESGCSHNALTEGECIDGDACTIGDHCEEGECVGLPIVCDDGNPCTDDECDGLGGCAATANHVDCDDDDPCTVGDTCKEGLCVGYAVACDCLGDSDCGALEDGDVCNGTLVCDLSQPPFVCIADPATGVTCPQPEGPDGICLTTVCDPESGECSFAPDHEGFACDDEDPCTVGDVCVAGVCTAGVPAVCNDGNLCTDDECQSGVGCVYVPNEAPCDDDDVCTSGDACMGTVCIGGDPIVCDDGNLCTDDSCDSTLGCVGANNQLPCDDGNACTKGDQCAAGSCQFVQLQDCDDENPCTGDWCDDESGCMHQDLTAPCDDGDPCTLNDKCVDGACVSGVGQQCDDGNSCTSDSCQQDGSCLNAPADGDCDDGNACTDGDACVAGECVGGAPLDCDDGNLCTSESCSVATGCVYTMNDNPCDDGDLCTTQDACHLGQCASGGELNCDDGNLCTDDSCSPEAGCQFTPNTEPCDDGSDCTLEDACSGGWCISGDFLDCDDGKLCTDDSCDPDQGCVNVDNDALCNDGDECTVGDICQLGVCVAGEPANCNDENQCTVDSCHPLLGCVNDVIGGGCDDGNDCTVDDQCILGECQPGPPLVCEDDNVCTDNTCEAEVGCVFINNDAPCTDDDACTLGDHCANGQCASDETLECDDFNECTDDSCDDGQGCLNLPRQDGTDCGGADDVCLNGECTACGDLTGSQTFGFTGGVQNFEVPLCITVVTVDMYGAEGGKGHNGTPAKGGRLQAGLAVTPGETLSIRVGGQGDNSSGGPGGWNGGGQGGPNGCGTYGGGGGGGASDVRRVGDALDHRVAVAGGGGGGGADGCTGSGLKGGVGGGLTGGTGEFGNGCATCNPSGAGGTPNTGGKEGQWGCASCNAQAGTFGQGGAGNTTSGCGGCPGGGGGGGGWYGGGGGGLGAGGGGSSYTVAGADAVTHTQGVRSGNGEVHISW